MVTAGPRTMDQSWLFSHAASIRVQQNLLNEAEVIEYLRIEPSPCFPVGLPAHYGLARRRGSSLIEMPIGLDRRRRSQDEDGEKRPRLQLDYTPLACPITHDQDTREQPRKYRICME
jgi:hypothetical protein